MIGGEESRRNRRWEDERRRVRGEVRGQVKGSEADNLWKEIQERVRI